MVSSPNASHSLSPGWGSFHHNSKSTIINSLLTSWCSVGIPNKIYYAARQINISIIEALEVYLGVRKPELGEQFVFNLTLDNNQSSWTACPDLQTRLQHCKACFNISIHLNLAGAGN